MLGMAAWTSCFGGTASWLFAAKLRWFSPNLFLLFTLSSSQLWRQSVNLHHQYLAISIFILFFDPVFGWENATIRIHLQKMTLSKCFFPKSSDCVYPKTMKFISKICFHKKTRPLNPTWVTFHLRFQGLDVHLQTNKKKATLEREHKENVSTWYVRAWSPDSFQ